MLDSRTVRKVAELVGVHRSTSLRWRHRFINGAERGRPAPLVGIVDSDDTFMLESQKGSRYLDRPARRCGHTARDQPRARMSVGGA